MTEAEEIARNMIKRAGTAPIGQTVEFARAWVVKQWPDWREWISAQMLDNIAEAVDELSRDGS